ncbi:hypothetical protein J3A83DRAFT_4374613 [Scleroderma citrinum]
MFNRSTTSGHSLCSKGPIIKAGSNTNPKSHKKATNWSDGDTTGLLEFLIEELPKVGNGNFKRSTWMAASFFISTKFKVTNGGAKYADGCEHRFQLLKKQYDAVVNLKNASGFTYSDKDSAGITLPQADVWSRYVKPFKSKGFIYFKLVKALISKKGKVEFVFHPATNPITADLSGIHNIPLLIPTTGSPSLNLKQLTAVVDETTRASHQQPGITPQGDLNVMPTSVPSSYLSLSIASKSTSSTVTISVVQRERCLPQLST